jgi:hypothetical protein
MDDNKKKKGGDKGGLKSS